MKSGPGTRNCFYGLDGVALRELVATITLLTPEQSFIVEARHPVDEDVRGMAPFLQVLMLPSDEIFIEVPGNEILEPPFELTEWQETGLAEIGFTSPGTDDAFPGGERMWRYLSEFAELPYAAAVIVCVLTDVFALPVATLAVVRESSNEDCEGGLPCLHRLGWHSGG